MKFVYKPEGAEPRSWDFEPDRILNVEAEVIERKTGFTYQEWLDKVRGGSMLALHGLLFIFLKREDHKLQWDSVQFTLSELDFEIGDDEAAEVYAALKKRVDAGEELPADEQKVFDSLQEQGLPEPGDEAPKGELIESGGTST